MRSFTFFLILFLISGQIAFSQTIILCPENKEIDVLIDKAIASGRAGDSKTAIENLQKGIAQSKSAGCLKGEMISNRNLMVLYSHIAKYEKSLKIAKETERLAIQLRDYKVLVTVYSTKATLYDYLGLYKESIKQYDLALKYASMIEDPDRKHYSLGFIYYNLAPSYQDISLEKSGEYLKKARNEIEKIKDNSHEISLGKKKDMLLSLNMNLGIFYKNSQNPQRDIQRAESYFMEALKIMEDGGYIVRNDTKIDLLNALTVLYNVKEEYDNSILYGEKMLELEGTYSMPYNRKSAYMQLTKSYLATGDNETSQKYLKLYTKLNDSIVLVERKAVEKPINEIISKNKKNYSDRLIVTTLIAGGLVLLFIFIGLVLWKNKKKALHKRYESLINNFKPDTLDSNPELESETVEPKQAYITDETGNALLQKLEKFEKNKKYLQKDTNLTWLANHLNTNTRYLSEIIKIYRNKSFSNYINGLRIDYIVYKLLKDPVYREYKIEYLAEESGYASRQVFVISFKKETGFTPSYFIKKLEEDNLSQIRD